MLDGEGELARQLSTPRSSGNFCLEMTDTMAQFQHWSKYWASGALTSLPEDFRENYDGEVAEFWRSQFNTLLPASTIVDLCCGNGAIALLAARHARQAATAWQITAVDAADLPAAQLKARWPSYGAELQSIHFLGGTPIEQLPLLPSTVDLACSQFGLEYCDLAAAGLAIHRVLKPNGRLALVSHEPNSDVFSTMNAEAKDYLRLHETGLIELLGRWAAGEVIHADLSSRLTACRKRLTSGSSGRPTALISQVLEVLAQLAAMPTATLRAQAANAGVYRDQLVSAERRMQDLLRVLQSMADTEDWTQPLNAAGLDLVSSDRLYYRGRHLIGTARVFVRSSQRGSD